MVTIRVVISGRALSKTTETDLRPQSMEYGMPISGSTVISPVIELRFTNSEKWNVTLRLLKLVVPDSGSVATTLGPSLSGGPPVGLVGVAHEYAIARMQKKIEILKKLFSNLNLLV